MDETARSSPADGGSDGESASLGVLNWEQVQRLDAILAGSIPIHGRWSFPTLDLRPRDIVKAVRSRMEEKRIHVREVRLNGSAASYVLHEDSGLGWKDLDLIFCAELKGEAEFQTVKDIVLDSLLDFLPEGVNKEKITPVTLKVMYDGGGGLTCYFGGNQCAVKMRWTLVRRVHVILANCAEKLSAFLFPQST